MWGSFPQINQLYFQLSLEDNVTSYITNIWIDVLLII